MNTETLIPTSFQAEAEKLRRLDALAEMTGHSRDWLVNEAIDSYLSYQEWFVTEARKGIAAADRGEFASDEEVHALFERYGAR